MPSQLKSRDELPWLYYPRSNSVRVINSHLGGGGGSLAVNGKMPIAAYIPSLDTFGNGTTTLTDLIGSNNGTLTNMDAASDWVADTDAGGVRALDFDGTNDYVSLTTPTVTTAWSFCGWFYFRTLADADSQPIVLKCGGSVYFGVGVSARLHFFSANIWRYFTSSSVSTGQWCHIGIVKQSDSLVEAFYNGTSVGTLAFNIGNLGSLSQIGSRDDAVNYGIDGRADDMRFFDSALDSSDFAYLYNIGNGRGRTS